jgi:hypothetical protein
MILTKAEEKLKEAKYFLDKLKEISRTISAESDWKEGRDVHSIEPIFKYNFSACVTALRSVFDVLLYDYSEKYFKYSPARQYFMNANLFSKIADACGSFESKKFIKWFREKFKKLKKEHLFFVRIATVHRGGTWMDTNLKDTYTMTRKGIEIKKEIWIAGMPETVAVSECERIYYQMDEIVKESRETF